MNKKTLTKLEYHKIIDILIEQATSFGGKERCKRLKPMTSLPDINTAQEQTAAAFTRIIRKGRPSFGSCNPVGESLKRLEVGAALGSGELLRICKLLENAGQIKAYGRHETVDDAEDCLDIFFQQIEPLTLISTEIRRCIIDEDEISDDASSTLKQIRHSMNQINAAQRTKAAAQDLAEADRIRRVTEAKAEAEAMEKAGEGIANQRKAIALGIKDSLETIQETGVGNDEANQLFMFTQWTEMMNEFAKSGKSATVVLPSDYKQASSMFEQMLCASEATRQGSVPPVDPQQ